MNSGVARGIALGLWILTGLAFLVSALFPRSSGAAILGPVLLTLAVLTTALLPLGPTAPISQAPVRRRVLLSIVVLVLALSITLTIIREGDRRSFVYVLFVVALTLLLKTR